MLMHHRAIVAGHASSAHKLDWSSLISQLDIIVVPDDSKESHSASSSALLKEQAETVTALLFGGTGKKCKKGSHTSCQDSRRFAQLVGFPRDAEVNVVRCRAWTDLGLCISTSIKRGRSVLLRGPFDLCARRGVCNIPLGSYGGVLYRVPAIGVAQSIAERIEASATDDDPTSRTDKKCAVGFQLRLQDTIKKRGNTKITLPEFCRSAFCPFTRSF